MNELDRQLNADAIAEQRRSRSLRRDLIAAVVNHRIWVWSERWMRSRART